MARPLPHRVKWLPDFDYVPNGGPLAVSAIDSQVRISLSSVAFLYYSYINPLLRQLELPFLLQGISLITQAVRSTPQEEFNRALPDSCHILLTVNKQDDNPLRQSISKQSIQRLRLALGTEFVSLSDPPPSFTS